jgi:hypothetical protein
MSMTILELTQASMAEMGLGTTSSAVGSSNQIATQLVALANAAGRQLAQANDWQSLIKEQTFQVVSYTMTGTTTSGSSLITDLDTTNLTDFLFAVTGDNIPTDTYITYVDSSTDVELTQNATASGSTTLTFTQTRFPLPDGFSSMATATQWNKSQHLELIGPETPALWQWQKSGWASTGPRLQWRIIDGRFEIFPPNSAADTLRYEYLSNYWASNASGDAKASFTADSDRCVFPDEVMIAAMKVKFLQAKNLPWQAAMADYVDLFSGAIATDAGAGILRLSGRPLNTLIGIDNIPETGYGQ